MVRSGWTAKAQVDEAKSQLFGRYGNTGSGWTGADSTYSAQLTDDRTAWLFSDTFLGPVNPDLSRPTTVPFINNSVVVQRADSLSTVTGGTRATPDSLVPPAAPDTWNWLGAAIATPRSLDVMFLEFGKTGSSTWDFAWRQNKLVRFDPNNFAVRDVTALPSATGVEWASWLERVGGVTYIYGVEDQGVSKYMHLARVVGDDITQPWQFWTGGGWSDHEADSVRIMAGVANEYSVSKFHDGYLLVTHDTNELFSRNVLGYVGCSPWGPFTKAATLYQTPESGLFGSYGNPNIITYNSHEHPDLRQGDKLLVTYNVNSLDPNADLYKDVSIYRPRFVDVELTPVSADSVTP